ncbi:WD_REPEATS_REGION domain-containing protein [Pseudozyma hubeiensis]|nr:WD_REPEATS_REGION domain-containing protein [Pseudozyma hubeiensis]
MPTSFGGRRGGGGKALASRAAAPVRTASSGTAGATNDLSSAVLGKRPAEEEEDEEDDGLTAEERAANRAAEEEARERRARGIESSSDDSDDSDDEVGPPPPPPASAAVATPTSNPIPPTSIPPLTRTARFAPTHAKTLSSLAVDPSGSRFCVGSYDSTVSLYDFGGMTSTLTPFRHFPPTHETYPILDLAFSPSATHLLVVSGTCEAQIFTRDAAEVGKCRKGDPYLRDMRHTKGHVSALTCGVYARGDGFWTGGSDSTVRLWSEERMEREQDDLIVVKSKTRGGRTKVTAIAEEEGGGIWVSGEDGFVGMWDTRTNLNARPRLGVDEAHERDTWTSCITLSGRKVVTRGGDRKVKVWDARQFRKPVVERGGLWGGSNHAGLIWDPFDSRTLIAGVADTGNSGNDDDSSASHNDGGQIVVLDSLDLSTVSTTATPSTPIRFHWSAHTDQLFTTHRSGLLTISYSPTRSTKGITLALPRQASSTSSLYTSSTPSSPPSYPIPDSISFTQSESAKRRRLAKDRLDPSKTLLPQGPLSGRGKGGRIGAGDQQGTVQSLWKAPDDLNVDPREALLKYADGKGEFTKAWEKTQPKTIYSKYEEEEEHEEN